MSSLSAATTMTFRAPRPPINRFVTYEHTHTYTHLYVQTIHCGESALWGKSVRPSWRCGEKNTHNVELLRVSWLPDRPVYSAKAELMWSLLFVSLSSRLYVVCHPVSRITHESVNACRPNMVGTGSLQGDHLQVVNFWC